MLSTVAGKRGDNVGEFASGPLSLSALISGGMNSMLESPSAQNGTVTCFGKWTTT